MEPLLLRGPYFCLLLCQARLCKTPNKSGSIWGSATRALKQMGPQPASWTAQPLRLYGGSRATAELRSWHSRSLRISSRSRSKHGIWRKLPWAFISLNTLVKWMQNINVPCKALGNNAKHCALFRLKVLYPEWLERSTRVPAQKFSPTTLANWEFSNLSSFNYNKRKCHIRYLTQK